MTNEELKEIYRHCFSCKKTTDWYEEPATLSNGSEVIKGTCKICKSKRTLAQLIDPEEKIIMFGKHKGKMLKNIPLDYLKWALEADAVKGGFAWAVVYILKRNNMCPDSYRSVDFPV